MTRDISDQTLLRQYLRGDRGAFDALFRRYAPRVQAIAWRMTASWEDAEDVLQAAFLTLARRAASIRKRERLWPWLVRVTISAATDRLRRRRSGLSLDHSAQFGDGLIAIESLRRDAERRRLQSREDLLARIESLIPRLSERQAAVFVLRGFQGMSHREIGECLGVTESCSKSHFSNACARMRQWIEEDEETADFLESQGGAL